MSAHVILLLAGLSTAWFSIIMRLELRRDWAKWPTSGTIFHRIGWLRRAALLSPAIIVVSLIQLWHLPVKFWEVLEKVAGSALLAATLWFFFYDGFYNRRFDRGWFHVGDVNDPQEKDNSWWDTLFSKFPVWLRAVIKIGGIVGSGVMYFK